MSLEEILNDLKKAEAEYEQARKEATRANTKKNNALNRLNDMQKKFDDAVTELRENATAGDWSRRIVNRSN